MAVLEQTIQQRRARVACESLLAIAGGQSVLTSNPNLNVTLPDYTVTVVVEGTGTISKGGCSMNVNQSSLTHLAYTSTSIYANAQYLSPNSQMWDNTADLVIGAGLKVQHLKIANRNWTIEELKADRQQPGYAPTSTHESILAHYVADRQGMVMWDVCPQYNYAKATALTAYHATLQNFTPTQVDTQAGTNSAYLDFYKKTILKPFVDTDNDGTPDQPLIEVQSGLPPLRNALRFDASQNQYASVANLNVTKEKGYTFLFTLFYTPGNQTFLLYKRDANSNIFGFLQRPNGELQISYYLNGSGSAPEAIKNGFGLKAGLNQIIISLFNVQLTMYQNGRVIQQKSTFDFDLGYDSPVDLFGRTGRPEFALQGSAAQTGIAKGVITPRQVAELWNNSLLANPKANWKNLEWQIYPNWNKIDGSTGNYSVADSSPQNHTINLSGFTAANLDPQDPAYALTEINSLR